MNPSRSNTKNALEWSVFGLGLLMILAAVTALIAASVISKNDPARLTVATEASSSGPEGTLVPVLVSNQGSTTAAEVSLRIEADFPSGKQTSEIVIDFVPRGGDRRAYAKFSAAGPPTSVTGRVVSYADP